MSGAFPGADVTMFFPLRALAVNPSSTDVDLTVAFPGQNYTRFLYVGGTGDVAVVHSGDTVAVTYKAVPVGTVLRGCFQTLKHTGTTATNIVAGM